MKWTLIDTVALASLATSVVVADIGVAIAEVPTRNVPGRSTDDRPSQEPSVSDGGQTSDPSPGGGSGAGATDRTGSGDRSREDSDRASRQTTDGAGWKICNMSSEARINVVALWQDGGAWRSSGWMPIARGTCRNGPNTRSREAFYVAVGKGRSWSGNHAFCIVPKTAQGRPGRSCGNGAKAIGLRRVNLGRGTVHTNLR